MFDIKVGDMVLFFGEKCRVKKFLPCGQWVAFYDGDLGRVQDIKPVVRLTPLVRAELRLKAERQTARPGSTRMSPRMWEVSQSVSLIQSIGGYEAAQLYTDCDGYVNGRFIRGDDVRRALRILEGL